MNNKPINILTIIGLFITCCSILLAENQESMNNYELLRFSVKELEDSIKKNEELNAVIDSIKNDKSKKDVFKLLLEDLKERNNSFSIAIDKNRNNENSQSAIRYYNELAKANKELNNKINDLAKSLDSEGDKNAIVNKLNALKEGIKARFDKFSINLDYFSFGISHRYAVFNNNEGGHTLTGLGDGQGNEKDDKCYEFSKCPDDSSCSCKKWHITKCEKRNKSIKMITP